MSAGQLLREYAPPPLFHGRHWGDWVLDTERIVLVFEGEPCVRGGTGCPEYIAFLGRYEVDIERIANSAGMLDWIYQVGGKVWATARVTKDLLNAFDDIFAVQANLCSCALNGGSGKVIKAREFLKNRIASVGHDRPLGEAA